MKTKVLRRKPLRVTFDLGVVRRVSTPEGVACRIVDGYSYVNAWVGDGVNLTRESMVAATDDYNRWGAVRQMHQPSAVGRASGTADILNEEGQPETIALGVFWDAKGATCRSLIVDPEAIVKLDTGVYKAYSVGVAPTMMRGVDVIQCTWLENSLVDRPADPDAILTLVRGAESVDLTADVDVLQVVERSTFGEEIDDLQNWALDGAVCDACYVLMDCLWEAVRAGDAASASQSVDEFATYVKGLFGDAGPGMSRAAALLAHARTRFSASNADAISRLSSLTEDLARAGQRASVAEADLVTVRAALAASQQRVQELERQPDPAQPVPVRVHDRTVAPFAHPDAGQDGAEIERLNKELADLVRTAPNLPTDSERQQAAMRINRLRQQLHALGAAA